MGTQGPATGSPRCVQPGVCARTGVATRVSAGRAPSAESRIRPGRAAGPRMAPLARLWQRLVRPYYVVNLVVALAGLWMHPVADALRERGWLTAFAPFGTHPVRARARSVRGTAGPMA